MHVHTMCQNRKKGMQKNPKKRPLSGSLALGEQKKWGGVVQSPPRTSNHKTIHVFQQNQKNDAVPHPKKLSMGTKIKITQNTPNEQHKSVTTTPERCRYSARVQPNRPSHDLPASLKIDAAHATLRRNSKGERVAPTFPNVITIRR